METMLVIHHQFFSGYIFAQGLQTFLVAETVISFAFFNQFLCVLQVNTGLLTFTLYVWAASAVFVRTFVMDQTSLLQRPIYDINCTLYETLLVGIFDAQHKGAARMFGDQIGIQCRS